MWYHPMSVTLTHKTASLERDEQHVAYQNLLPSAIATQSWAERMKHVHFGNFLLRVVRFLSLLDSACFLSLCKEVAT